MTFTAPSRRAQTVRGFWDGATTWRVRFSPDEVGTWSFATSGTPDSDSGLHAQKGSFRVVAPRGTTRLERHGPIRASKSGTFLEHADGTPFFWLADTGWNAALLSTPEEFDHHIKERVRQRFTAVQWVVTQWRAAPTGDLLNELAFTGKERIAINPAFFQRLDAKIDALNRAGLLSAPVMLWAIGGGSNPAVNPGFSLPEDQAIKLTSIDFWRLRPAQDVLAEQPGVETASRHIMAAASNEHDLLVVYTPEVRTIELKADAVPSGRAMWYNPCETRRVTVSTRCALIAMMKC